ncbi:X-ray radiation resistance-associated protein 1 [Lingula anatina]|uniref:X-ray radiation resistance-associated protein 1 n=1 Tax=Lingula anatina TaxID=7574 RepID=A0A1S3IH48_LINAN|nr:X-ray radiation resistance-associated protein 1 [Lingula anatina]|eukprot:XP_013397542.1 X-ray radiation resistance-associated protein 1 [Lingula anatina]
MAIPGVKYDDGGVGVPGNCFPVRSIFKQSEEGGGAWLVSLRAEQRRRFKAVLCSKPKTYSQIKEEKKQSAAPISTPRLQGNLSDEEEGETLDGFYLMKHSCVEDPSDLCSVNICGKGITEVKEEDLGLFDNVAYVNAGENFLPFEAFRGFPIIRELEIPLNGLRGIRITRKDFPHLEVLDLSYNNLAKEDILMLGVIPKLRVLHLTGNNFKELPPDLAQPFKSEKEKRMERFPALEILFLDDNKLSDLSTFSALAGLRRLRHLSLEKNNIFSVPQLRLVGGRLITQESPAFKKMKKSKTPKSRPLSARSQRKMEEEDRDATNITLDELKAKLEQLDREEAAESAYQRAVAEETSHIQAVEQQQQALRAQTPSGNQQIPPTEKQTANEDIPPAEVLPSEQQVPPAEQEIPPADVPKSGQDAAPEVQQAPPMENQVPSSNQNTAPVEQQAPPAENPAANQDLPPAEVPLPNQNTPLVEQEMAPAEIPELPELPSPFMTERANIPPAESVEPRIDIPADQADADGIAMPPPFPELQYLNLAFNQIEDQEALLPVAAWPMLNELVIHDNPLTTRNSGDPPILKQYLQDRLGIRVVRKKPQPAIKPHVEVPQKASRKVKTVVPPIPRCNVDELLALEAPKRMRSLPSSAPSSRNVTPGGMDPSKPLPPIAQSPKQRSRPQSAGSVPHDMRSEVKGERSNQEPGEAWPPQQQETEEDGDTFFMTQIDENITKDQPRPPKETQKPEKQRKKKTVPGHYKGYEILLDAPEDPNTHIPKDLQGSVRALKQMLDHPIVFRDNVVQLDRIQKPFEPYKQHKYLSDVPPKTYQEKVDDMLTEMKTRTAVTEAPLNVALKDKRKMKDFPEAPTLLGDVQRKYNAVRTASMHDAREARKALKSTLDEVSKKNQK